MTKLAKVLESGLAGATTLSLLTDTLRNGSDKNANRNVFHGKTVQKRLKKAGSKKPLKATQQYVQLAGDLLAGTASLGLLPMGKKNSTLVRGAVLGAVTGLGSVLLHHKHKDKFDRYGEPRQEDSLLTNALEVSLYAIGGAVAASLLEKKAKKKKGKRK